METYRRAQDEYRRRSGKTDGASVAVCEELGQCMEFCAYVSGLLLNPALSGTFPQSARDGERGVSVTGRDAWVERDSERVSGAIGVQVRGRRIGGGGGEDFRRIARVDARDESAGDLTGT